MKIAKYILILAVILNIGILKINTANALEYKLLEPLPCVEGTGNNCTSGQMVKSLNVNTYLQYVFRFAIALAVFLSVVVIIFAGFRYMMSEAFTDKGAAKNQIKSAVIGLLGALCSYLILYTIDPRLVRIDLSSITKIDTSAADKELQKFYDQLQKDMQNISKEARDSAGNIGREVDKLKEEKAALDEKADLGPLSKEDKAKSDELAQKIKEGDANQYTAIGTDLVTNPLSTAIRTINFPSDPVNDSKVIESNREIINSAKTYANKLKEVGAYDKANDINMLVQFGNDQIDTEIELRNNINAYTKPILVRGGAGLLKDQAEAYLKEKLDLYSDNLKDPLYKKYILYDNIKSQYESLRNARIIKIKTALGIK